MKADHRTLVLSMFSPQNQMRIPDTAARKGSIQFPPLSATLVQNTFFKRRLVFLGSARILQLCSRNIFILMFISPSCTPTTTLKIGSNKPSIADVKSSWNSICKSLVEVNQAIL